MFRMLADYNKALFVINFIMSTIKILFVCMGNICRSPTAEGAFRSQVEKRNVENLFEIDSAGTHAYHIN